MANTKTVLIVEDEKSLAEPLKLKLKKAGYSVYHGKNGQEGLDLVAKVHPDIILLDLLMPVMDGAQMLKHLSEKPETKNIKVIILSNISDVDTASKVAGMGAMDYVVKSDWKLADIVARVGNKLRE
jgi:DNA-binding response OmpR family regulator